MLKIEPWEITAFFYNIFSDFGGGGTFGISPWLRHCLYQYKIYLCRFIKNRSILLHLSACLLHIVLLRMDLQLAFQQLYEKISQISMYHIYSSSSSDDYEILGKFGAITIRGRLLLSIHPFLLWKSLKLSKWTRKNRKKWYNILGYIIRFTFRKNFKISAVLFRKLASPSVMWLSATLCASLGMDLLTLN